MRWFLAVMIGFCGLTSGFAADKGDAAGDGYRHPVAAIPYAWTKPVIDGVVSDEEWNGAMSHQALQTTNKQISARQTRYYMMWDEENIYVAMRDPLRQGERPVQSWRGRERDLDVIFDDCYEVWVSVDATDPLTGQPNCFTQFLGNYSGARFDALHQPAVGNSRTSSYVTNWEPKSRITEKNEWEMELVIPRASLGTTKGPFHDGMHFRTLIARNYKRPWEQNSFEGTSSFSVTDTHSEFVMSKTAPALHLLSVGSAATGKLGLHLAARGQTEAKIHWEYRSDTINKKGEASVKKDLLADVVNLPELDVPGPGKTRITVTDDKGTVLLDWSALRAFGYSTKMETPADGGKKVPVQVNPATEVLNDRGDVLDLRVTFNQEKDYLRVFGDLINYDNRGAISEIVIVVSGPDGKELKRTTTTLDEYAYARAVIAFDSLPEGTYQVGLDCRDANGKTVASKNSPFTKDDLAKKYPWWKTTRGSIEKVISPWTPVTRVKDTFGLWGREMTLGAAGLPSRVVTQGHEVLAAPGRLVANTADGGQLEASGVDTSTLFDQDHRKTMTVKSRLGDMAVESQVMVEFDGLYKVTMTLTPTKATTVKDLKIILPYTEAMAEYIHAVTAEIRSAFYYGFTPAGKGRVWDCTSLGDKTMKVGSFIPYVWLGSTKGGLCWFADGDEGWVPNDETPAIEIQRNVEGQVDLVFNLISSETLIDKPRTITFGLQASPVKAMHKGWREDNWWCGDTFRQYAHSQNLIFASTPFIVPSYLEEGKAIVDAQHKAGRPAVPYFIHTQLPGNLVPEMAAFSEQWKTTVDDALCYRGSFIDYMIHNWSQWAEAAGIDGYYIDNMRPLACDNLEHGCGYRLPDGRIQPTFQMFDTRVYFLRSRALFLEQRPASKLVIHMTNAMIIPWVGPADVAYDGEHHVIYPEMKKDFMDFWSLERLRIDFPSQWGVAVNFMAEYQGSPWDAATLHNVHRAYFAAVMLQDALPTGNHNGHANTLIDIRSKFGIGADDVRFLPYWDKTGIATADEEIKLAGWLRPDKMLLLVSNFGEARKATLSLDPARLGWEGATLTVTDSERGYQKKESQMVPKITEELAAERAAWEAKEADRIAIAKKKYEGQATAAKKNGTPEPAAPDLTPKPYQEQLTRREQVIVWNGDDGAPAELNGTTLTVPVERHNYRLLIIERK